MQSFGIPEAAAQHNAVEEVVKANASALYGMAREALTPVAEVISRNDAALGKIRSTLNRSVAGRVAANNKKLGSVAATLQQQLQSQVSANAANLAMAESAARGINPPQPRRTIDQPSSTNGGNVPCGPGVFDVWSAFCGLQPAGLVNQTLYFYVPCGCTPNGNPFGFFCLEGFAWSLIATNLTDLSQWPTIKAWTQYTCPPPPPPPTCPGGVAPDPVTGICPPPPPPPTCPGGVAPDPITGECPPPPPPPPPTPCPCPPGGSCDQPLYISICEPPPPPPPVTCPGGAQPDATGVCPPPPTTCPGGAQPDPETGECPPLPEEPPADYLDVQPITTCGLGPDGSFPPVGSASWCVCIDNLLTWFNKTGKEAAKYFASDASEQAQVGFFSRLLWVLTGTGIDVPKANIKGLLKGLTDNVGSLVATALSDTNAMTVAIAAGVSEQLFALALCKTVIRLLNSFHVGINAVVRADINIELAVHPVEQVIDYLIDYVLPTEVPSIPDAMQCYLQNTAPEALVKCWLLLRGADLSVWQPVMYARREKLAPDELIQWLRRNGYDTDAQVSALRNIGFIRESEASAKVELYDQLPSIADVLHWLQRNVYDDEYVRDYQLLDGFDVRFWSKFGAVLNAAGMRQEYAALHYAAHWINPAPEQLREMVYRLRPDKQGVQNPFTSADYQRILAEQDVAPFFRPRFGETLYRVPALGYLRDMFRQDVISADDLKSYHRDLGFSEQDSTKFVSIDSIQRIRMRAAQSRGWTTEAIANAVVVKALTYDQALAEWTKLGYYQDELNAAIDRANADIQRSIYTRARGRVQFSVLAQVKAALDTGVSSAQDAIAAVVSLGWPQSFAEGWVQIQSIGSNIKLVKQATARIRSAYLAGEIDTVYASQALQSIGVVNDFIQRLLATWRIELTPRRKRRSAAQIVSDVANAEITTAEAYVRLTNLGYDDADTRLYLADAQRKILATEAKAIQAREKAAKADAAALAKAQKEAANQARRLMDDLRRLEPPSKLDKWAKQGLINFAYYSARMSMYGYSDAEIKTYWESACESKGALCPTS